jgi:hypothetical protein
VLPRCLAWKEDWSTQWNKTRSVLLVRGKQEHQKKAELAAKLPRMTVEKEGTPKQAAAEQQQALDEAAMSTHSGRFKRHFNYHFDASEYAVGCIRYDLARLGEMRPEFLPTLQYSKILITALGSRFHQEGEDTLPLVPDQKVLNASKVSRGHHKRCG